MQADGHDGVRGHVDSVGLVEEGGAAVAVACGRASLEDDEHRSRFALAIADHVVHKACGTVDEAVRNTEVVQDHHASTNGEDELVRQPNLILVRLSSSA